MKNFVQNGDVITLAAPTGGVKSGDAVLIGSLFGVAATDAAEAADVEVCIEGVFTLPKTAGAAINQGAKTFWDVSASACVAASGAGNAPIGVATETAGSAATTVRVRLDGVGTAAA